MTLTPRRLVLLCGLVPTLALAAAVAGAPGRLHPPRIRRLRSAGAGHRRAAAQRTRGDRRRGRAQPFHHRAVAVAPRHRGGAAGAHPRSRGADDRRGRHLPRVRSRRRGRRARCRAGEDLARRPRRARLRHALRRRTRRRPGLRAAAAGAVDRAGGRPGGRPVLPRHRRRVQPARAHRSRRRPRVSQRRAGLRRHPPPRAAAGALRRGHLSEPRARNRRGHDRHARRRPAQRERQHQHAHPRRPPHRPGRQEQPAGALPRQEAHLPLRLGGRRDAEPRAYRGRSRTRW